MYQDHKACEVCGSEVEIRPHEALEVNEPDSTIDERVCTNPDCPTNQGGPEAPKP
jgi:heterodisulfide reductase subunit A-like polyferredoxin